MGPGSCRLLVSAMDFFDDPNLFVGGLEGLDEDGFPSAPSLVDELNLSADFEPLQGEALDPGKSQDMMPAVSTPQALPSYNQPMGHYIGVKAENPIGQTFSGSRSTSCGMIAGPHHGQHHNAAISQVPQSNGLFCNSSSPMWGNQDQNGNVFLPLSQQHQHQQQQLCHQQLHSQQLHARQHTQQQNHSYHHQQEEQQRRMRQQQQLQQQQNQQQQLLNQHQQINTQTISLLQQQHHNFSFHQGGHSSRQQQVHHSQQQMQHQLTVSESQFRPRVIPSKSFLETQNASLSGTSLQAQQQQGSYQLVRRGHVYSGSGVEDSNLSFSTHSSIVHSLPTCSVSSTNAYQPAQYPAYPGESEISSLSQQSLSSASVSRPTTTAPLSSTVSELSETACQFQSPTLISQLHSRTTLNQAEECPFRALRSGETQGNCKSSEMFGESMNCYPSIVSHLPSEQPRSCGAINTNGYQALEDSLLSSGAQHGDLEGLEPTDLLPDLLPQLEDAFRQQEESCYSWVDSSQEKGYENGIPASFEYKDEKVICLFGSKASACSCSRMQRLHNTYATFALCSLLLFFFFSKSCGFKFVLVIEMILFAFKRICVLPCISWHQLLI